MNNKKTIGICGYGMLGKAFEYAFAPKCNIVVNDLAFEIDNDKFFSKRDLVLKSDLIMVGIPTPYSLSDGYIPNILDGVLDDLNMEAERADLMAVVLIKSAMLPSHVKEVMSKYRNLDILVSPEYLSGKANIADNIYSNIHIIGGSKSGFDLIRDLILNHSILNCTWSNPKIRHCSAYDAALIKYMENCFLAMKCTFMSEFYELHEKIKSANSVTFDELLELWQLDPRMGDYPYQIPYNGELGRCSHCLCKDTQAIMDEFAGHGVNCDLLRAEHNKNELLRSNLENPHDRCKNTPGGVV